MENRQKGYTLIEMLVVLAVGGIVLTGLVTAIFQTFRITSYTVMQTTALENIKNAVYKVSTDVKQSGATGNTNLVSGAQPVNNLGLGWIIWYDKGGNLYSPQLAPTYSYQYGVSGTDLQRTAGDRATKIYGTTTGTFTPGEIVQQASSEAIAIFVYGTANYILVRQTIGTFTTVGNVTGNSSLASLVPNSTSDLTKINGTISGTFTPGETVTQTSSGATATFVYQAAKYILMEFTIGTFKTVGNVTGNSSNASITPSDLIRINGKIYTRINGTTTGTFTPGETVTQASSQAIATFASQGTNYILVQKTSGTFTTSGNVTGNSSLASITPTSIITNTFTLNETVTQTGSGATATFLFQGANYILVQQTSGTFKTVGNVTGNSSLASITPSEIVTRQTVARYISSIQFSRSSQGNIILMNITSSPERKQETAMQKTYQIYLQPQVAPLR